MKSKRELPPLSNAMHKAAGVISQKGNRLTLTLAWMLWMLSAMLCFFLNEVLSALAWLARAAMGWWLAPVAYELIRLCLWGAVTLFLLLPLLQGILGLSRDMMKGEIVPLADLFRPFSARWSYAGCLSSSVALTWRGMLTVLVIRVTYGAFQALFSGQLLGGIVCAILILGELFLGFWLCVRVFPRFYFAVRDERMPGWEAMEETVALRRAFPTGGFRFFCGFLPRILLGCCTIGLLLLVDTLPMMCLTYVTDCETMNEIRDIEEKDHE